MYDPAKPFRLLARNNRLANLRLANACKRLPPGEFEAARTSFFPSIRATLNHILTIDWFYVDAFEGGMLGPKAWEVEEPFDAIGPLADAQAAIDQRLLAVCETLTPEILAGEVRINRQTRIQRDSFAAVLLHLFQHDTHHRGQVHAMLSGTSVPPPQLDEFLTTGDARFRAVELYELGWTEAGLAS